MATVPAQILPLLSDIDSGSLVLTPNHRTSVQLLDWYGQYKYDNSQKSVCPSPSVYPVDIWIRQQGEILLNLDTGFFSGKKLLQPVFENLVWHNLLQQSETGSGLLNASATARAAQETWTLTRLWQISDKELNGFSASRLGQGHDDLHAYLEWSTSFTRFCQEQKLFTLVQLLENLIPAIDAKHINLPNKIILCGFENPPPLYQQFINALKNNSREVIEHNNAKYTPTIKKSVYENAETEFNAAAQWARKIQQTDPHAKIGIVIPDLYSQQAEIKRTFSRCFTPLECNSLQYPQNTQYAISASTPLKQLPIIKAALLFLGRNRFQTDTLETCLFLRSVFLVGAVEEEHARGVLEKWFRDRNESRISNADLRSLTRLEQKAYYAPLLSEALNLFDLAPKPSSIKLRTTRQWCEVFERQLTALGWPGTRSSTKEDKAAIKAWFQVLADFNCLTTTFGKVTLEQALDLLNRLVQNAALRVGSPEASVQVLTPTEAAGLQFSHCWMTGLSEQQWPPAPKPSPFIPYTLQKNKHIPDADISLHTQLMQQTVEQRVANTSQQLILSYPNQNADLELKPAAILNTIDGDFVLQTASEEGVTLHPLASAQTNSTALESFVESNLIPLKTAETVSGGSALIADQAECPFRSFVKHRLKARPIEKLVTGLSARAAGSLVHRTLELFWQTITSQASLISTPTRELDDAISTSIDTALRETRKYYPNTMTEEFCALEKNRLRELLLQWLEEERKRGSFTVIASEFNASWQHAELSLNLRIDRIDQTADNTLILVDYKTSRNISVNWEDERPANPQLMLYSLSVEQHQNSADAEQQIAPFPVAGVFFAQVNIEASRYKGLSENPGVYPASSVEELSGKRNGLSETASWENIRRLWEQSLGSLAEEFLNGCASVTPRQSSSCNYCFVRPVCRIDENLEASAAV